MDNYVLVERLGQGSFAVVWKARRKSDNRLVAAKQLKQAPSTWEECKRLPEIRAATAVRGAPHVIALLEAVRHGSELFLVFEYADSDLYRCLGPNKRFEEPQVRWVMRQLLLGLAAVHAAGLAHCDVKPENLLLFARSGHDSTPVLKLCDLGQAAPLGEVQQYVGTRWYRAPEQLLGVDGLGVEIDLWAASCTMAELILLRPAFPGTDTRDMLFRICSEIGAPEEKWTLSQRLMEASGLRFAPSSAEGPFWFELAAAGASPPAVELVRALLRYEQRHRAPASRALQMGFFEAQYPEVAIAVPRENAKGTQSVEKMQRSRDEAKAVERKLHGISNQKNASSANAGTGLGGFGFLSNHEPNPSEALPTSSSGSATLGLRPPTNQQMRKPPHGLAASTGRLPQQADLPFPPAGAPAPTLKSCGSAGALGGTLPLERRGGTGGASQRRELAAAASGDDDDDGGSSDEELAKLFWNKVENSRMAPGGPVKIATMGSPVSTIGGGGGSGSSPSYALPPESIVRNGGSISPKSNSEENRPSGSPRSPNPYAKFAADSTASEGLGGSFPGIFEVPSPIPRERRRPARRNPDANAPAPNSSQFVEVRSPMDVLETIAGTRGGLTRSQTQTAAAANPSADSWAASPSRLQGR